MVYKYPEKKSRTLQDHIAINFKTLEQDGLLLHSEGIQGDLFTLELKKGRLYLHISLGTTSIKIFLHLLLPGTKIFVRVTSISEIT